MPCMDCAADITTAEGDVVCETCAPDNHVQCNSCDEWRRSDGRCTSCVTCARCHELTPESDAVITLRGSTICDECRDRWYWRCQSCDGWNRDGAGCANGCCSQDCECDDCCDEDVDEDLGGLVHDYEYKPRPMFHGTGPLFLGAEIEIETPHYDTEKCAKIAQSHLGSLGYLKTDSSIGHGFEIVTHPMSYDWALANFPWPMLTALRNAGCYASASTGIHVHVSRAGFSSACHTYRWMKFIYRNEQQVKIVARRCSNEWAAFTDQDRAAVKDYAKGAYGERYRAINTNNTHTFELRVFASSLNPGEVQAALGLAAASIEYTRDLSVPNILHGGWTWTAFVAWLAQQPAYAPLAQQLEALACVC